MCCFNTRTRTRTRFKSQSFYFFHGDFFRAFMTLWKRKFTFIEIIILRCWCKSLGTSRLNDHKLTSCVCLLLQDQIPKDVLLNALTLEFVNRVNEVGVDINRALAHPHTAPLVQFVCGLGPRKGAHLLKILKQNNIRLENRTQLVTLCHMGPKVFINCAGFIKIDTFSLMDR